MDLGHIALDSEVVGVEVARNSSGVPAAAGALPTYIIYDADGNAVGNGTCTAFGSPAITGCYRFGHTLNSPAFVRKQTYFVLVSYAVDGDNRIGTHHFKCA